MMTTIIIYVSIIGLMAIIRPITVLMHELGHGIPALLLTKNKVQLFIGSYGDPSKSLKINIGRLEIFFKYNPFLWKLGVCVPKSDDISLNTNIVITIFGPLTSLFIGILSIYISFAGNLHGSIKIISVFILISSLIDFFVNIIPSPNPFVLHDGSIVYNDGQQLRQLMKYKKLPSQFNSGLVHFDKKEYEKAAVEFQNILSSGLEDENIFRLTISSLLQSKNYKTAMTIHEDFERGYSLNSDDYSSSGLMKSNLEKYEDGLLDYQKSLKINPHNIYTLNNRGYTYNLIGKYEKAIVDFDMAIKVDPDFAYSYNNRGLAKIKLGKREDGLDDINKSIEIDASNSYAFRNLGIYYFDSGDFEKAMGQFEKALQLDAETHLLEEYILKTENEIRKAGE